MPGSSTISIFAMTVGCGLIAPDVLHTVGYSLIGMSVVIQLIRIGGK